jgi:hypothetical protein
VSWNPLDAPVDYIELNGKRSPGLADVTGAHLPRNWDKRKGYGLMGAFTVFHGMDLVDFTVTLRLYTAQDWDDWFAWKPLVDRPPDGKRPRALKIKHPLLAQLGVSSVVVTDVHQPKPDDAGSGMWSIDIKFLQYRVPLIKLAKPDGAAAPAEEDPVETKIIKPLVDQFQQLAKGP